MSPAKRFRTLRKAQTKQATPLEERKKALEEIFYFYARQHIQNNLGFEEMEDELKKLDMGEFTCLTRDFSIALPRSRVADVFKKASANL